MGGGIPEKGIVGGVITKKRCICRAGWKVEALRAHAASQEEQDKKEEFLHGLVVCGFEYGEIAILSYNYNAGERN